MGSTTVPQLPRTLEPAPTAASEPASSALGPADQPTDGPIPSALSRRGFLRGAAIAGGGLVAATLAACTPGRRAELDLRPRLERGRGRGEPELRGEPPRVAQRGRDRRGLGRRLALRVGRRAASRSRRLDPARPRCPDRHPALHRQPRPGPQGHLRPGRVRQARRDPRRRRRLPRAPEEAGVRPGPEPRPDRRPPAAQADRSRTESRSST